MATTGLNRPLRVDVSGEFACFCRAHGVEFLSSATCLREALRRWQGTPAAIFFKALIETDVLDRMEQFTYYGAGYDRRNTKRFIDRAISVAVVV